jgi:hypothetical protein
MFEKARAFLLSLTIIAVLLFSAVGTTVVYADGGTPPDTTTAEEPAGGEATGDKPGTVTVDNVETKGDATPVPTVELAPRVEGAATPVPTEEVAPVKEEAPAVPAEAPVSAPATDNHTASSGSPADKPLLLDAVPDNTTVAVVNAEGQLQSLATQAAADAIATSDPIWCPAGQAPTPGLNGCTQSFTSFTALLTFLSGNASFSGAGIIYVQSGTVQAGASVVDFNNYDLSNISNADLTITGGWDTSTGTINSTSTFNNASIIIGNSTNPWGGTLTINNITITNPSGTGITVNAQNNININNVTVTNSTNGAGAELTSAQNVNINNSRFERNKTAGAIIRATGNVAIANTSFSNPATARRQIMGVDIISDGSVSLLNVIANENREAGAHIVANGAVSIANSVFSGTKAISGSNFLGYGLTVESQSVINLDHVTANDNFLWGASLTAVGDVSIANSIFNANTTESPGFIDDTGLLVTSGGMVSIANTQANDNRLIGAVIDAVGDVSISNSTFSSNNGVILDSSNNPTFYGYGLQVVTDGSIFLDGVTASNNTLFGAHLESGLDILVTNSDFSNQTSGDATALTGRGLEIISGGNVLMQNVTLNNNQTFGAQIQAGADVFLDTVTADGNGTTGLQVQTNCGTLFLMGGTYQNNGQYGLSILSTALNQSVAPVFANNGAGNIFQDPGTCVFAPATPPTPPANPPVYQPNDLGAVAPRHQGSADADAFARSWRLAGGSLSASGANMATLNTFLTAYGYSGVHIGPFTGKYAYVYLSSGMKIVVFDSSSLNEFAMNGS